MNEAIWDILSWIIIVFLTALSGLFSGLNLGLMGLDLNDLSIYKSSDNLSRRTCATKIEPLRKTGNWLLCTLLLGNVTVNAGLSILLADKSSGLIGFFISTSLITMFGEVIPQALCSRYALQIGAATTWLVVGLMGLMAIIAYPISWCLDKALGDEENKIYTKTELQNLIDVQQKNGKYINESTSEMVQNVLGSKDEIVFEFMTKWNDVFWLNANDKLTLELLEKISKEGKSRIPVLNDNMNSVGLLYAKDLILLFNVNGKVDEIMSVGEIIHKIRREEPLVFTSEKTLQNAFTKFVGTKQHLAFVKQKGKGERIIDGVEEQETFINETGDIYGKGNSKYVGIITLEDVTEHILGKEFYDEYDDFGDNQWNVAQIRSLQSEKSGDNVLEEMNVEEDDDGVSTSLLHKKTK